jgi:hypothetical protein
MWRFGEMENKLQTLKCVVVASWYVSLKDYANLLWNE